jgi:hypothetical protein
MPTNFLWATGTGASGLLTPDFNLMTSELTALASGSGTTSSVNGSSGLFTNTNTAQGMLGEVFYRVNGTAVGGAVTAGGNLAGWFLTTPDSGTTIESYTAGTGPIRAPDFFIPLQGTPAAHSIWKVSGVHQVIFPALQFKMYLQNNIGQALPSTDGGTLIAALVAAQY